MKHECIYCNSQTTACAVPCAERLNPEHVCCTCGTKTECELPYKVVCSKANCQLLFKVDHYKQLLEDANGEISKLKSRNNEWRIANIGSLAAQRLCDDGTLEISGIKSFVSRQRATWDNDDIAIETHYIVMCLHQEFAEQYSQFLNERAVKLQIKKDLIKKTADNLNKAQKQREGLANNDGTLKSPKKIETKLTPFEKTVLHNMKSLKLTQVQAEEITRAMGLGVGETARDLKSLGLI